MRSFSSARAAFQAVKPRAPACGRAMVPRRVPFSWPRWMSRPRRVSGMRGRSRCGTVRSTSGRRSRAGGAHISGGPMEPQRGRRSLAPSIIGSTHSSPRRRRSGSTFLLRWTTPSGAASMRPMAPRPIRLSSRTSHIAVGPAMPSSWVTRLSIRRPFLPARRIIRGIFS